MTTASSRKPRLRHRRLLWAWGLLSAVVFIAGAVLIWLGLSTYYECRVGGVPFEERLFDSLYRSAQLFTLTFTPPPPPAQCALNATPSIMFDQNGFPSSPWPLLAISVLAPLLTLSGLIGLVGSGLDRWGLYWRRRRGNLLVVCGTGERGLALLDQEHDAAHDRLNSVAVSLDRAAVSAIDDLGALFVEGDAQEAAVLQVAGVGRRRSLSGATAVVVTTDNERVSEEIAEAAHALIKDGATTGRSAEQWVAFHTRSKSRNLEELTRTPLATAPPFPVDLTFRMGVEAADLAVRMGTEAAEKSAESAVEEAEAVSVCVLGAKDVALPVSVVSAYSNSHKPGDSARRVTLILPASEMDHATTHLGSQPGVELSPVKVDIDTAVRGGDDKEAERLVAELEQVDVAIVALRDDNLACDLVDLLNEHDHLRELRIVVCIEGSGRSMKRLLESALSAESRTDVLRFAEVSGVHEIGTELEDLRKMLTPLADALQGDAASEVRLEFGSAARTADDLQSCVDAVCDGLCEKLHERSWRIASIDGPNAWYAFAMKLTEEGNEASAFIAWCEWVRAKRSAGDEEVLIAAVDGAIKELPGSGGAETAARTAEELLGLFKELDGGDEGDSGEALTVITGNISGDKSKDLGRMLDGVLATKFVRKEDVQHESSDDSRENLFGADAGFRSCFEIEKRAEVQTTATCADFRKVLAETDEAEHDGSMQALIRSWRRILIPEPGAPAISVKSSALLALSLREDSDVDRSEAQARLTAELVLARALGFGHIAASGTDAAVVLPSDRRGLLELPLDRMTLRAFLHHTAPKEADSAPLSRGCELGKTDGWAQQLHENYIAMNDWLELEKNPTDDPAMQPWKDLVGFFKESNRSSARDWGNKIAAIGETPAKHLATWARKVRPSDSDWKAATPRDVVEKQGKAPDDEMLLWLELLAEMEHGRWNFERISAGWSFGDRDVGRKMTNKAKPWDDAKALGGFDDKYRDLDRQQMLRCLTWIETPPSSDCSGEK